ncbi:MAG: pitrilysin family protein [Desulfuromonas sp.]|nr:pitrilysin family protein [Desulfuromonas sp.]
MLFRQIIVVLALLSSMGCVSHSRVDGEATFIDNLKFPALDFSINYPQKFKLNNGIQVYFKQDSELPLLDVSVVVAAGKVGVPNKNSGVAELLASILRSGGAGQWDADQLDQHLEDLAADLRVTSDAYSTSFDLSLLSEDAVAGLELLSAMVRQPRFAQSRFAVARQQLLESIRRRGDNSAHLAQMLMMSQLYADHPLANYPTQHSVAGLTVDSLKQQYEHFFSPTNTRIVISGAITQEQARSLLEHSFGDWQAVAAQQIIPPQAEPAVGGTLLIDRPIPQTTVMLVQLGIEKNNPDLYAVQVMNYILGGGGFSSRLMREIRSNRGLAYSVYSYYSVGRRLKGPFIACCETKNSAVAEVVGLLRQEMELIREHQVTPQELNQAKESLVNSFVFAFDDSHALAKRIMEQDMYDYPPRYLEEYRQRIQAVSVEDVQRVARKYLNLKEQTLILIGDKQQLQPSLQTLGGTVTEVALDSLM